MEISEYGIATQDSLAEDYSAKLVKWNDRMSVVLNNLVNGYQASFGLLKNGDTSSVKTVFMPLGYKINDFTILNDTLYFVGNKQDDVDTTKGFIGYVKVSELFGNPNQVCSYAEIRSTKDLFRVEAYNDSLGQTIVAAVGRQLYGKVYYVGDYDSEFEDEIITGPELPLPPGADIVEPQIMGENQIESSVPSYEGGWSTAPLEYRYCLATLNIKRTIDSVEHKYDLWYLPEVEQKEQIRDFCLTKDFICVVASYYENLECADERTFAVHWFDKNNLNVRYSKETLGLVHAFDYNTNRGNLKTTSVGDNDIAICYMGEVNSNCNVLYKLQLDTTISPIFTQSDSILLEKQYINSLGNCYDIRKEKIHSQSLPVIKYHPLMERCQFVYMINFISDVLTPPAYQSMSTFNSVQIKYFNIAKPCENDKSIIIYEQPKPIN